MAVNEKGSLTLSIMAKDLASGKIGKFVGSMDRMARKGGLMGSVFQGVGIQMGMMLNPLGLMTRGFGMVVGAVGSSIGAAADFDEAMTKSLAIMGDVSDAMRNDMSDAAREVGKATTFSAKEAADAYFFLASAGLDAAKSVKAMPKVARFAQAGNFDLALATDLLTDAQSALGLSVDDTAQNMTNMTRVSDVLVKANTAANATVQQFSESLTNKGAAALRLVGKELEEGAALLAAWADQGVKGVEAGTRLDIVLRDLQKAAIENEGAFADQNIAVFDSAGEMRNLADIIADMEGAFDGLSDKERRATLMMLGFTSKSVSATSSLLGTSKAIRRYEKELRSAGGTTQTVADKQLESFRAKSVLLDSALNDIRLTVGMGLTPALGELADVIRLDVIPGIGDMFKAYQELPDALQNFIETVALAPYIAVAKNIELIADGLNSTADASQQASREAAFTVERYLELAAAAGQGKSATKSYADTLRGAAEDERQAAIDVKALDVALKAVADSGFKDVKEAAKETRKALQQAFKAPESMKQLLRQEKALIAARNKAIRLKDTEAFAIADNALKENRTSQGAIRDTRKEMRAIRDRRRTRKEEAQANSVLAKAEKAQGKARRADLRKIIRKLGVSKETAADLLTQVNKDYTLSMVIKGQQQLQSLLLTLQKIQRIAGLNVLIGLGGDDRPPEFHQGTPFVQRTGLAVLERGERVISKEDNRRVGASAGGASITINMAGGIFLGSDAGGRQFAEEAGPAIMRWLRRQ